MNSAQNHRRFYQADLDQYQPGDLVNLSDDQARHAIQALRLQTNQTIELFDGRGNLAQATITQTSKKSCQLRLDSLEHYTDYTIQLEIIACPPKGQRLDTMIEKLSELGVNQWTPLASDHAVVQPRDTKLDRLKKITISAAKQCKSLHCMRIAPVISMQDWLKTHQSQPNPKCLTLICDTPQPEQPVAQLHRVFTTDIKKVQVLIGPEGGWSDQERAQFLASQIPTWTFASNVLRIETAAMAAAALLVHQRDTVLPHPE